VHHDAFHRIDQRMPTRALDHCFLECGKLFLMSKEGTSGRRRLFRHPVGRVVAAALAIICGPVMAQQSPMPRVGFLSINSEQAMESRVRALREGLRELGYVEGKNLQIEFRYAAGIADRLGGLTADLVQQRVDVIVTEGPSSTRAAHRATTTIPIVMGQDPDPVSTGFVATLSKPGGNITGLTSLRTDLSAKRVEMLKRAVPGMKLITVVGARIPGTADALQQTLVAAQALGARIHYVELAGPKDVARAFKESREVRSDAMILLANPVTLSRRSEIAQLALKDRLPVMYYTIEFVDDGGLMAYGVNVGHLFRRAATYVDRILKGANPAELPVEQPTKFELVLNLKTAKQTGLTIPQDLISQADRIIE
jgi:putative ABC transport system substrate-binding protein